MKLDINYLALKTKRYEEICQKSSCMWTTDSQPVPALVLWRKPGDLNQLISTKWVGSNSLPSWSRPSGFNHLHLFVCLFISWCNELLLFRVSFTPEDNILDGCCGWTLFQNNIYCEGRTTKIQQKYWSGSAPSRPKVICRRSSVDAVFVLWFQNWSGNTLWLSWTIDG